MTDETCETCGDKISRPAVTVHRGRGDDLRFCSFTCHGTWDLERAVDDLGRVLAR